MWFPLFEYSIVAYLLLDITNTTLSYKRGEIPLWFNRLSIIICWVTIFLAIQFRKSKATWIARDSMSLSRRTNRAMDPTATRTPVTHHAIFFGEKQPGNKTKQKTGMIFVCIAYDNPRGHTLGFLGLQVALLLIAFQNAFYVVITGQSYPPYLTAKRTQMVGQAYLAGLTAVGVVKVAGTVHIVTHGVGPDWYKIEFLHGMVFGKCVDIVWMVFNAVIPFFIAAVRAAHEQPLKIEISCSNPEYRYSQTDPNGWIDEDTELMPMNEGTRLLTKREQDWVAMQS
mmetsp:Transcript_23302/g.51854  ORF Transcript_23302/g.51854 Transcript_23302/m.51854 type:complete len:283 (-) Transcript_23302:1352-2200(-)